MPDPKADSSSAIFQATIPFVDSNQEKTCRNMIASLSESQIEQAACTSYAYDTAVKNESADSPKPSNDVRQTMAVRMARRCLVADDGNEDKALKRLIGTLQWREENKINDFRDPYESSMSDKPDHPSNHPLADTVAVNGYDVDGHAVVIREPLKYVSSSDDAFIRLVIYGVERAIACTERRTLGREEKLVVAYDFSSYVSGSSPPFSAMKTIISIFGQHYPERLQYFVCADPPFLVDLIRKMVWPFVDSVSKAKTKMVKGENRKEEEFKNIFDVKDSMPFLRKGGMVPPWDRSYWTTIPFDHAAFEK